MALLSAHLLRAVAAVLRDYGIEREGFLERARISAEQLEGLDDSLDFTSMLRAITASYELTKDPALALRIGMQAPPQLLSVFGDVLLHCPTIRAALRELEIYAPVVLPSMHFELSEQENLAHLNCDVRVPAIPVRMFLTELCFGMLLRMGRHFASQKATPLEVRLAYSAPSYAALYAELFQCPVKFDCARTELVFDRSMLDITQPFADEAVWQILKRRADDVLMASKTTQLVHERVKLLLRYEGDLGRVDVSALAQRVGLSPRSLRERLAQEGRPLLALIDEVRRELAERELADPTIPIKSIAERVGFSEVSAFYRAFRRWTGTTPAKYRADAARRLTA